VGLTIYYQLTAPKKWSVQTVREKLEALRQACLDLPVVEVSELGEFEGKDCEPGEDQGGPFYLAKIQSSRSAISPWQPGSRYIQYPSHMLAFSVWPARGCDEMALAEVVGQWDRMLAGLFGMLKDADSGWDSAMAGRPDFEQLEAKAHSGEIGKLLGRIRDHLPRKDRLDG
jgi:hypothetical protein